MYRIGFFIAGQNMLGNTLIQRVRGGVMAGILTAKTPAAATAGRRSMSLWSDMPMGPPDPILGLTGQSLARVFYLPSNVHVRVVNTIVSFRSISTIAKCVSCVGRPN